jgi:hypothetical protein
VQDTSTVQNLPSNGRDWTQAATLQAGVSSIKTQQDPSDSNSGRGQRGFGAQISVSGGRPQQNNYILNGISISDYANSAPGSVLGLDLGADAVERFSVMTSNYPADFGRSSGGIVNAVTHSGTDQFHGAVYEYVRNSAFDAKNYFDGAQIPPFSRNQFGVAVGGPMARQGRALFFANYEGLRQSLGITRIDVVPSAAARNGQLSSGQVAVDPQAQRYLAFFPLPNRGTTGNGDTGSYAFSGQQVTPENYFTARTDIHMTKDDVFSVSYVIDRASTTQPDTYDILLNQIRTQRNLVSSQETHAFSTKTSNSLRLGVNRVVAEIGLTPMALQPIAADISYGFLPDKASGNINVVGLSNFGGGLGSPSPYKFHWTSLQAYDDVSTTRGRHDLRIGAAVERMLDNMFATPNPNGVFAFNSLQDFLTNRPYSLTLSVPGTPSPRDLRQTIFAVYAQDVLRLTPRLTVNAGLRYEIVSIPTETRNKLSALRNPGDATPHLGSPYFANPTHYNLEPRFGIAYDLAGSGRYMLKTGLGIFDVLPLPYEFELISQTVAPFLLNSTPTHLPAGSFPGPAVQLALSATSLHYVYIDPKPKRNYVAQWNLSVEMQPTHTLSIIVGYVGSRGIHQPFRADDANIVLPTHIPLGYVWPAVGAGTRINPIAGRIDYLAWRGDSNYNALQTQFQTTFHGLQMGSSYTWSKSLDTGSGTIAGDQFSNSIANLPWYDLTLDYGPSDFNLGQTFTVHLTYPFPTPARDGWYLRGWHVVGNFSASSGSPFTPTIGGDPLGTGSVEPYDIPNRALQPECNTATNHHNAASYLKLECFAFPNPATMLGNLHRNSIVGPGLQTLDVSLFKDTTLARIRRDLNLQFRAEVFNVFNHPNLAPPLEHDALFNAQGASINGAGQIVTTATPSRQMQLGIKLIW